MLYLTRRLLLAAPLVLMLSLLLTSCGGAVGAPVTHRASPTAISTSSSTPDSCGHLPPQQGLLKFAGLAYGPYHGEQTPEGQFPSYPSAAEIQADMPTLKALTDNIRIYSSLGPASDILQAAQANGLKVALGIWLGAVPAANEKEIAAGEALALRYPGTVSSVIVGNEVLLRGDLTEAQLHQYLQRVRARLGHSVPITLADIDGMWLTHPALAQDVDFITAHIYPFWRGIPIACAIQDVARQYHALQTLPALAGKPVVIGETGWPSTVSPQPETLPGTKLCAAQAPAGVSSTPTAVAPLASPTATSNSLSASPANQALYLQGFITWAKQQHVQYYYFDAFDEAWKIHESGFGTHWGLYQQDGTVKPDLAALLPPPAPATLTQRSYRDVAVGGLEPGFDLGIDTSQHTDYTWLTVHNGVFTLKYPANQDWGTMFISVCKPVPLDQRDHFLDLSAYHAIEFDLRMPVANTCLRVGIKDWQQPDDGNETTVDECPTTQWATYTHPLSVFSRVDLSHLYVVFEIAFSGPAAITVQVRNIRYAV